MSTKPRQGIWERTSSVSAMKRMMGALMSSRQPGFPPWSRFSRWCSSRCGCVRSVTGGGEPVLLDVRSGGAWRLGERYEEILSCV